MLSVMTLFRLLAYSIHDAEVQLREHLTTFRNFPTMHRLYHKLWTSDHEIRMIVLVTGSDSASFLHHLQFGCEHSDIITVVLEILFLVDGNSKRLLYIFYFCHSI